MKILFFLDRIGGGGRERRMAQLVRALDREPDIQMKTVTTTDKIDYIEVLDTKMEIEVVNSSSHFLRYKQYNNIIKDFRPDIIHLWTDTPLLCATLPKLSNKYECKFIVGFVADGLSMDVYSLTRRVCIRHAFRKADAIVSNSKAGLVAKKAPMDKSVVIYNGFDKNRLAEVNVVEKRKALGITTKNLVTMCARVNKAKDWDMFIQLAERKELSDTYFLAVGDGELLEMYRGVVKNRQLKNICFIGRRSDVMEILAATDVSLLLTNNAFHAEGVSNSIMESMAAGVPVVATEGGGTPEIITNAENGFIIESENIEQACKYLSELLNNDSLRFALGTKAKETISSRFNLEKMGKEYLGLYNQLLG